MEPEKAVATIRDFWRYVKEKGRTLPQLVQRLDDVLPVDMKALKAMT
jgi:hypothetical protein